MKQTFQIVVVISSFWYWRSFAFNY